MSSTAPAPSLSRSFPSSTASPSRIFQFPGISPSGTAVVRELLTENDRKYDIFNKIRYHHNHFSHSILARYALGAPPQLLRDTWSHDERGLISIDPEAPERQRSGSRKGDRMPKEINRDNWDDPTFMGYDGAYAKYLAFFHQEISRLGPIETLKTYVFSPQANWEGRKPQMLSRLHGGYFHPFIHVGCGLEFQDRILIAEGLAEACIHSAGHFPDLFDPPFPKDIYDSLPSGSTSARSDKLSVWAPEPPSDGGHDHDQTIKGRGKGTTLLEIYAEVYANPKMTTSAMKDLASNWTLEKEDLEGTGLDKKVEEVAVLATLLTCATGGSGKPAKLDFFLMHALTSSIFLHSYLPYLDLKQRKAFLFTYVLTCLATAISRGRPRLDPEWLMSQTAYPAGPGTLPSSTNAQYVLSDPTQKETQNSWTGIIQSSIFDTDAHVPKAIRSLVHFGSLYGGIHPGEVIGAVQRDESGNAKSTLPGSDKLDGTMFVRAAGIIMDKLGWCREGQKAGHWDYEGFGR